MTQRQFSLFQSHIDLAHSYWKSIVREGDMLIDATCGNGHDALVLARLNERGRLLLIDKQKAALESTQHRLASELDPHRLHTIEFKNTCHSKVTNFLSGDLVRLLVFNLGYLPGGDKSITTEANSTLHSIQAMLEHIAPGGAISVTCYPGHDAGAKEEEALLDFVSSLDKQEWSACHHRWLNRTRAPSLLLLQKNQLAEL
ncbi:MAG: 16S rRNA (cytosine(1402)-N(4))-methyltransferase [Waddliaceae bacterium]|nr:16S rRNA (cytosine(1402)-N(4))-methyltransferase [Waddliaceae bacterium]